MVREGFVGFEEGVELLLGGGVGGVEGGEGGDEVWVLEDGLEVDGSVLGSC